MTVDFFFQSLGYGFPQHHPRSAKVHESTWLRQVVLPGAPERIIVVRTIWISIDF